MASDPVASFSFQALCEKFEYISQHSAREQKLAVLTDLWKKLSKIEVNEIKTEGSEISKKTYKQCSDFHLLMRLVLPHLDTARSTYGLKETKIAAYYIDLLGLSKGSSDAVRLLKWKDPGKSSVETTSFSDVIYVCLSNRGHVASAGATPMTIGGINQELDGLAAATSMDAKKSILMRLVRTTSALEQKWLIRIIMKDMKMHLAQNSILHEFHPDALQHYNNTNDLAYVCRKCTDPTEMATVVAGGSGSDGIFLMKPLKPMLASRVDSAKLAALLRDEKLLVEPKYDGERMMIHMATKAASDEEPSSHRVFKYWTRNAKDYTMSYGPKFNPVLVENISSSVQNCILDGEFLLWDADQQQFHEFGQNRTFATSAVDFSEVDGVRQWFCYCVFDICFLNGESLTSRTLLQRKAILKKVLTPKPTMLELVPTYTITGGGTTTNVSPVSTILSALDQALSNRHEGIMIKCCQSSYIPGERKLKWLKLKPDVIAGMADTLDLVVLGGYYGTKYGLRRISHFLLGVYVNGSSVKAGKGEEGGIENPGGTEAKYHTLCKVGTGYTEAELVDLLTALDAKWLPNSMGVPKWLDGWTPAKDDLPDVYVHPKDSIVMEVYGYSFTDTTKFKVGKTIRFPRCRRIRIDKGIEDATDMAQLRDIIRSSGQILKRAEAMDALVLIRDEKKQHRKQVAQQQQSAALVHPRTLLTGKIPNSHQVPKAEEVPVVSRTFDGFEICVLYAPATERYDKMNIERMILAHCGYVTANPGPQTAIIVSALSGPRSSIKVRNWIAACEKDATAMRKKYHTIDIVSIEWLMECINTGRVLPFTPRLMVYASEGLQALFAEQLDSFFDAYCEEATPASLAESIHRATSGSTVPGARSPITMESLCATNRSILHLRRQLGLPLPNPMIHCFGSNEATTVKVERSNPDLNALPIAHVPALSVDLLKDNSSLLDINSPNNTNNTLCCYVCATFEETSGFPPRKQSRAEAPKSVSVRSSLDSCPGKQRTALLQWILHGAAPLNSVEAAVKARDEGSVVFAIDEEGNSEPF